MDNTVTQIKYVHMPSEPPAALVEKLQGEVFGRDDTEIGLGLSFHCYRRIFEYLQSHGTVLEFRKPDN